MSNRILKLISAFILSVLLISCSDRFETPSEGENSTKIYRSKSVNGIEASITFCERISKQTGEPLKPGTVFATKENSKVYSFVKLNNRELNSDKLLMFHIDWLDSTGNSIFKKRIDLTTEDSSASLISSINTSQGRRQQGKYSLRVYLFRELIAEKNFELVTQINEPEKVAYKELLDNIKANITLCKGISKKTGKLIGAGNKFEIKDKAKVLAIIKLENKDSINRPLTFYADWSDQDDSTFYRKKIEVPSNSNSFSSSVSISPDKRLPGNYRLRIFLSDKILNEKSFTLVKAVKKEKIISKNKHGNFSANIILCERISKKTGLPINPDSVFTLNEKENLKAIIYIGKQDSSVNQKTNLLVDWIDPDNKSFYKKKIELTPADSSSTITSSISISPQKRQPGNYTLRVYHEKELIGEKKFILKEATEK